MTITYLIAETLALLGFLLYLYGISKTNNHSLFRINLLENTINLVKNLLLGGFSAVIVQVFGTISLLLKVKGKFNGMVVYLVVLSQVLVGLLVKQPRILRSAPNSRL